MLSFLLIRPGCTDFDEQRRIKGSLDIPLSPCGLEQVDRLVDELKSLRIDAIYHAPCESAQQTAIALGDRRQLKAKSVEGLKNLNHGLWHGKLIDEVKKNQPKVYRQWQEHPESVCPPEGETLQSAAARVRKFLQRTVKKHREGVVALVVNDPLASVLASVLKSSDLGDLWKSECDAGSWELIDVEPKRTVGSL